MIRPPALSTGDAVAIVAPAGPVDEARIATAMDRCRRLGLEPVPGEFIRERAGYLAGPDERRAADLNRALAGDAAAIWSIRGGYGMLRTLPHLGLDLLRERPKAFIGFSDNTALHLALLRLGIGSFHGPNAGSEHFTAVTEGVFRDVLWNTRPAGELRVPEGVTPVTLRGGVAEGRLVGGNLALLAATCGTPYQADASGAILFLEDLSEHLYRVDRMLVQLALSGVLDGVVGLALGQFTDMPEPVHRSEGGAEPCLEDLCVELADRLGVPAVLGLPFGHGVENWTLPMGVAARLDADAAALTLLEPAVD